MDIFWLGRETNQMSVSNAIVKERHYSIKLEQYMHTNENGSNVQIESSKMVISWFESKIHLNSSKEQIKNDPIWKERRTTKPVNIIIVKDVVYSMRCDGTVFANYHVLHIRIRIQRSWK